MAPVISWVEDYIGHRVTVTFSIDVRDVNLAQRLQVHSTTFLHNQFPVLLLVLVPFPATLSARLTSCRETTMAS